MYLKQKLDEEQIAGLPRRYQCMRDEIDAIIRARLTASTIPVGQNEAPRKEKEPSAPVPEEGKKKRETVNPQAPCPCGSGKKYGECHGLMDNRRKGKRRI
jgi:preprotein translocase subunit SecA